MTKKTCKKACKHTLDFISSRPRLSRSERVAKLQAEIDEGFQKLRTALSRYSADCLVCLQAKDIQVDAPFLYTHLKSCQVANAAGNDPGLASILGESADDCIHRIKSYLRDSRQTELLFDFGQVWPLSHLFCSRFVKRHRFTWRAIQLPPCQGNTFLFRSYQQLPGLCPRPLKGLSS